MNFPFSMKTTPSAFNPRRSRFRYFPNLFLGAAAAAALCTPDAMGHGMGGHSHGHGRSSASTAASHTGHSHGPGETCNDPSHRHVTTSADADGSEALTDFGMETQRERLWGANLSTFWESKHIHYGITEADGKSVYGTELGVSIQNFSLGASGIFGLENDFQEWNFTAAYTVDAGPVFITPGFNFRWSPSGHNHGGGGHSDHHDDHDDDHHDDHDHHDEHGHDDHHDDHDHHDEHGHGDHHDEHDHGHSHGEYGYELFIVVGTTAIPYVVPSIGFLWDLADGSGGFMELRLDGDIPVYKDIVSLAPYGSLGLNFGYNTQEYYGWNNFIYGVNLNVSLTRDITIFGGVGQNVAFEAARDAGTSNEVFANTGISFNF